MRSKSVNIDTYIFILPSTDTRFKSYFLTFLNSRNTTDELSLNSGSLVSKDFIYRE